MMSTRPVQIDRRVDGIAVVIFHLTEGSVNKITPEVTAALNQWRSVATRLRAPNSMENIDRPRAAQKAASPINPVAGSRPVSPPPRAAGRAGNGR